MGLSSNVGFHIAVIVVHFFVISTTYCASFDKKGKHLHPQSLLNGFKSAIKDYSSIEIDLKGGQYTWEKRDYIELLLLIHGGISFLFALFRFSCYCF